MSEPVANATIAYFVPACTVDGALNDTGVQAPLVVMSEGETLSVANTVVPGPLLTILI